MLRLKVLVQEKWILKNSEDVSDGEKSTKEQADDGTLRVGGQVALESEAHARIESMFSAHPLEIGVSIHTVVEDAP
jgi:hypothetical protein